MDDERTPDAELVERWRTGDEGAVTELFERYFERLVKLVGRHLAARFSSRLDPQDVVQSVWKSMHRLAHEGRLSFEEDSDFWKLLLTVALNKVRNSVRYHSASRRDPTRETAPDSALGLDAYIVGRLSQQPTAAEMVEFADLMERVLLRLEPREQQLILLRLDGLGQKEIGTQLGVDERTVRRIQTRIRERVAEMVDEPAGE